MNDRKRRKPLRSSGRSGKDNNSRSRSRRMPTKQRTSAPQPREYQEGALPELIRPQKDITVTSGHSDEVIGDVFTALYDETTQQTVSFDEAITLIKERENIASDEELLYVGKGTFAVVVHEGEKNDRHQVIKRKIDFEQHPEELTWRESLRFDISLAGTPPTDVSESDSDALDSDALDSDTSDSDTSDSDASDHDVTHINPNSHNSS